MAGPSMSARCWRGWFVALVAATGCRIADEHYSNPNGDANGDSAGGCPDCQLTALAPATAATGATVTLEGTFIEPTTVAFPGGTVVPATLLGAHRATVVVPAAATAGELRVTSGGVASGPLWFHRAPFALGLQTFTAFDQIGSARQPPALIVPRTGASATVVGGFLYVIGGASTTAIERATINADGTVGAFADAGVSLVTARSGHTTTQLGTYLYVVGGTDGANSLASVERAPINPDGSLGAFADAGVALGAARSGHASVVIGSSLYVIGGASTTPLASIERAPISPDGTLGAFANGGVALGFARTDASALVAANFLYLIGGEGITAGTPAPIERAPINGDGTLGAFADAGTSLVMSRRGQASVAIGGTVYVIGGEIAGSAVATVESAPLASDGTLGTFAMVASRLTTPRSHLAVVLAGNQVLVAGGAAAGASFEQASIVADGTLGSFAPVAGVTLTTGRAQFGTAVLGNSLYVIGGIGAASELGSIERATIAPDGTLGPFAVFGVALVTPRFSPATAVIGKYLYVIGGGLSGSGVLGNVERAEIASDGLLGPFATVTGVSLVTPRIGLTAAVVGSFLYVFGGQDGVNVYGTIERAPINPDGSIGTFAAVSTAMAAPRDLHLTCVSGGFVYHFGGANSVFLNSVEHATANPDGSLGGFAINAVNTMSSIRGFQTGVRVGKYVYLIAGFDGQNLNSLERSQVSADGSLAEFLASAGTLTFRRGGPGGVAIGNYVYVVGGTFTSYLASLERAELQ